MGRGGRGGRVEWEDRNKSQKSFAKYLETILCAIPTVLFAIQLLIFVSFFFTCFHQFHKDNLSIICDSGPTRPPTHTDTHLHTQTHTDTRTRDSASISDTALLTLLRKGSRKRTEGGVQRGEGVRGGGGGSLTERRRFLVLVPAIEETHVVPRRILAIERLLLVLGGLLTTAAATATVAAAAATAATFLLLLLLLRLRASIGVRDGNRLKERLHSFVFVWFLTRCFSLLFFFFSSFKSSRK